MPSHLLQDISNFWQYRSVALILRGERAVHNFERSLRQLYEDTIDDIEKELKAFYKSYAKDDIIALADTRVKLTNKELAEHKKLVQRYIATLQNSNFEDGAITEEKILKKTMGKLHISRMEKLLANIKYSIDKMQIKIQAKMEEMLRDNYIFSYSRILSDAIIILDGLDPKSVNKPDVEKKISSPWLNANFNDRIWDNRNKLLRETSDIIMKGFVAGLDAEDIANDLSKRMGISYNSCLRLVKTEMNHIANQGILDACKDSGADSFLYIAILDERTSEICRAMDGRIFLLEDAVDGVTVPPLHPNCRSSICPYFGIAKIDKIDWDDPIVVDADKGWLNIL